jgi:signal recognition particle subunit SRP54
MNRLDALFTSMTARERIHPEILDMSRRRRIARGSGQEVGAVNDLLKSFKAMKQMMKQMNKLGLGAKLGSKAKKDALRGMSPDGELAADPGGGLLGGLGGLGGLFGGGGRGGGAPEMPDLAGMMGGPRPMGSSATRKSSAKRKEKERKKRKDKKKRR